MNTGLGSSHVCSGPVGVDVVSIAISLIFSTTCVLSRSVIRFDTENGLTCVSRRQRWHARTRLSPESRPMHVLLNAILRGPACCNVWSRTSFCDLDTFMPQGYVHMCARAQGAGCRCTSNLFVRQEPEHKSEALLQECLIL